MDDLGAEFISELSTTTVTTPSLQQTPTKDDPLKEQQHSQLDITPVLADLSLYCSDSEGKEKADTTPENVKKIDDVILSSEVITTTVTGVSASSTCEKIDDDESSISQQLKNNMAMAFTIDFGGGNSRNNDNNLSEQQAAKYRNMVERFQNRHKRGASMSKIESSGESSQALPPQPTTAAKVKLRIRERSTSGVRDSSNRHSWSPRSSTHEASAPPALPAPQPPRVNAKNTVNIQKSLPQKTAKPIAPMRRREFTPKSLSMQKAMEKFEFYLPEPPLISNGKNLAEADGLSEAGEFVDLC